MSLAFAIEQPSVDLADDGIPEDASTVNHAPDGVVAWRFENKGGHLQASGIVRALGYELDGAGGADGEGHRVNLVLKYDLVR